MIMSKIALGCEKETGTLNEVKKKKEENWGATPGWL